MRLTEKVTFPGTNGEQLVGRIDLPANGPPDAWALFAHCFTCSKDLRAATYISREMTTHGIAVLRFDFTGLGESTGDFEDTTFLSNVDDLVAASTFLAESYAAPSLLIGHSLGGAAVLQAADRLPSVRGVVTVGAPYSPEHVANLFGEHIKAIRDHGQATVKLAGRDFIIRERFLDDLAAPNMESAISGLRRALLVMHSPRDHTVSVENAARIFQAAKHPKSFVSLDDADHLLTREADARYTARLIAAWASRYVDHPGNSPR